MNQRAPLKKPVDWDDLYPGQFLKAGELHGRQVTLTIKSVDTEELLEENGAKVKGVLSFHETPKKLPLNKTNGICVKSMFGRSLEGWIGKRLTIYPDEARNPGTNKIEPAIRIWGSPHLTKDTEVEIRLPRRKPTMRTLHAVAEKGRAQQAAPAERDEMDPEPGAGDAP